MLILEQKFEDVNTRSSGLIQKQKNCFLLGPMSEDQ
jgi:hypothetical protein